MQRRSARRMMGTLVFLSAERLTLQHAPPPQRSLGDWGLAFPSLPS
jgi:hypothetical protein